MSTNQSTINGTDPSCGSGQNAPNAQDQNINDALSKIKNKIIVMSGKGGVGKSSFSTNLAVSLAQKGFSTGLLDVDLHGPSIAGMMGIEGLLDVSDDKKAVPKKVGDNLKVVSMQSLMPDPDQAVIWRGPAKTGVIRQFIGDIKWGELDFLIVDSPPGTGDEPLSIAQLITGAKALIVTTPQDIALADVRKSINFCRNVNLEIVGLVENMGPFPCPCCGKTIELFKSRGGKITADAMGVDFLGTLPFDSQLVKACDEGEPLVGKPQASPFSDALIEVVQAIVTRL